MLTKKMISIINAIEYHKDRIVIYNNNLIHNKAYDHIVKNLQNWIKEELNEIEKLKIEYKYLNKGDKKTKEINNMYIIVHDDLTVTRENINDDNIPGMIDSGYVSAVLRLNNGVIEYADVNWDEYKVEWKVAL